VVYGIVLPALYKYHIIIIMIIMIIMIIIHYDHDYPIIDYKHNMISISFLVSNFKKKSDGITHIIWFLEIILVDIRFIIWFHGYYLVIIWFLILPILDII
jgi:hypothetical protein